MRSFALIGRVLRSSRRYARGSFEYTARIRTSRSRTSNVSLESIDGLRALDAIDRAGSFTAAARELGRATSAVSYAIAALERDLALRLFDRTGHKAELTVAGRRVLEAGRRVLERTAEIETLARTLRDEWEPTLGIVVDGLLPLPPLLGALRRFSREGLPTHVQLRVEHLAGVRERFRTSLPGSVRADFMIVLDFVGDERLVARPLAPVVLRLCAHRDHPLVAGRKRRARVDRAELAQHVEIVVEDSRRDAPPGPGRLSLGSPHVVRLSDFHSKRLALLAGVGFGWMPLHLVQQDLARKRLVPLGFVEGDEHVFVPHLAWRRTVPLGRAAQRFLALLEDAMGAKR
ncbi:Transcriptional regulator, LysR family protein [Sandaracinus amylolyticus]|uniref:Transcriptional regulator, LysR family protein n=1 Tax=Sandaracinus amylolyticus TaxID=927083 RepID=A0A0F6YFV2_9BACT|nr:Transcriptional regulator, LysR family protein [Sandaracinus amylolyticus]